VLILWNPRKEFWATALGTISLQLMGLGRRKTCSALSKYVCGKHCSSTSTVAVLMFHLRFSGLKYCPLPQLLAGTGTSSGFSAAIARISSVIFIEQYFGPHMLQKWALLTCLGLAMPGFALGYTAIRFTRLLR
jgi:hypothetical protein